MVRNRAGPFWGPCYDGWLGGGDESYTPQGLPNQSKRWRRNTRESEGPVVHHATFTWVEVGGGGEVCFCVCFHMQALYACKKVPSIKKSPKKRLWNCQISFSFLKKINNNKDEDWSIYISNKEIHVHILEWLDFLQTKAFLLIWTRALLCTMTHRLCCYARAHTPVHIISSERF